MHPDDLIHVALDALSQLRHSVETGEATPWIGYYSDPDDPKTAEAGYLEVLRAADDLFVKILSTNGGAEALVQQYAEA